MISAFSVENYRSIDERVMLSLEASTAIKDMENKGISAVANMRILNTTAFFGANSSGKSNVFKAVRLMRNLVIQSIRLNDGEKLPFDPFLLSDKPMRPTRFEIEFVDGGDKFQYGFSYMAERIEEEWLVVKYPRKSMKTLLKRTQDSIEIDNQNFSEGNNIISGNVPLNGNRLFISLSAQLGGEVSKRVMNWFRTQLNVISGIRDNGFSMVTKSMMHANMAYKDDILRFICAMDVGFSEVTTKQEDIDERTLPKGLPAELVASLREHPVITAYSRHQKLNADGVPVETVDFDVDEQESDGTRKLFNLSGPIIDTLKGGKALFIDELDAQLHPMLSRQIVNLFNSADSNTTGAQLIFTSHDTNMLAKKYLRRDQVVFVEKDKRAMTHLVPMMSIVFENGSKPRTDSNYEKSYLEGKYGAVPEIESFVDGLF